MPVEDRSSSSALHHARDAKPRRQALMDLLERVKGAEGRDYALDFDILTTLRLDTSHYVAKWPLTSSLDAALALVARVRPRLYVGLQQNYRHGSRDVPAWSAWLSIGDDQHDGGGATPAVALLSALLTALLSQEEDA